MRDSVLNKPDNSPTIIGSGSSRNNIVNFYIHVDGKLLSTNNTALGALSTYVKTHYVLDAEFESNWRHVLKFISKYMFDINVDTITSQMRLINTALSDSDI